MQQQPPNLNFTDLVTGNGQQVLLEWFRTYRDQHGAEWLADIKAEWPFGSWVVELVTTKTADEAHAEICKHYPLAALPFAAKPLKAFHAILLEEIDKKR